MQSVKTWLAIILLHAVREVVTNTYREQGRIRSVWPLLPCRLVQEVVLDQSTIT